MGWGALVHLCVAIAAASQVWEQARAASGSSCAASPAARDCVGLIVFCVLGNRKGIKIAWGMQC